MVNRTSKIKGVARYIYEEELNPIIYAEKVTLCIPGMYDEDDDWEEEEENSIRARAIKRVGKIFDSN